MDGRHSGLHFRHRRLARVWAKILAEAGVPRPKLEPGGLPGLDVNRRGDLLGHDFPVEGAHTVLDFVVSSNVGSNGLLRGPADMPPGFVAERAADAKKESYALLQPPFTFVAAAYESYGRPCEDISAFMSRTAIAAATRVLGFDVAESSPAFIQIRDSFLGRWSKEISVSLQTSNAKMLIHGRAAGLGLIAGSMDFDVGDELQEFS